METCVCSAIISEDGTIISGKRHSDCFQKLKEIGKKRKMNDPNSQGFITTSGRYVTRKEGRILQENAGISSKVGYRLDLLFSEDLY